jgi:hypothetical protein
MSAPPMKDRRQKTRGNGVPLPMPPVNFWTGSRMNVCPADRKLLGVCRNWGARGRRGRLDSPCEPPILLGVGSRIFRILFIGFQAFWLNVVIPGHTRGAITIGGSECAAPEGKSCCASRTPTGAKAPTPEQRKHCAICFFAIKLCTPPVFDVRLEPLCPVEMLPVPAARSFCSLHASMPYFERGPPAC